MDDGFCSDWGKISFRIFMGIILGIQPIVRLRRYEDNVSSYTVGFATGCERNSIQCRCERYVESTSLFVRRAKIL
jgi:hypothetical protein